MNYVSSQANIGDDSVTGEQQKLLNHLAQLVQAKSVTPDDAGCQDYIIEQLQMLGFECVQLQQQGVTNLIAKIGTGDIRVAFCGHTDVVPVNNISNWQFPPFALTEHQGKLYGRGVADMKASIATMLVAIEYTIAHWDLTQFSFYLLLTSDEEGEAKYGSYSIASYLQQIDELPHFCLVGEPTANKVSGDVIKVGRRGAISGKIQVTGKAGHVAYPQFAENAVHQAAKVVNSLANISFINGCDDFPGTGLQVTAIDSGTWVDNIIPGNCAIDFNIRYCHRYQLPELTQLIEQTIAQICPELSVQWFRGCDPYFTEHQTISGINFITQIEQAIHQVTGSFPRLSTSGGTSDGRFFAALGAQVAELGPCNASIHQANEHLQLTDIMQLHNIYKAWLSQLLGSCIR